MPIDKYHAFGIGTTGAIPSVIKTGLYNKLKYFFFQKISQGIDQFQLDQAGQCFKENAQILENCRIGPRAWCINPTSPDHIQLGNSVICRGVLRCEDYSPGNIIIHDNVYIGDDVIISCANMVEIGEYTLLAHGVQIFDNDSHPVNAENRLNDYLSILGRNSQPRQPISSAPINIGKRCWIGINVLILKGVSIGSGSVVGAGSVVTSDIPENTLVAGNPARIMKVLS